MTSNYKWILRCVKKEKLSEIQVLWGKKKMFTELVCFLKDASADYHSAMAYVDL